MEKTIICLSNSRKISGRCIAGKEESNYASWIRPVSSRTSEEISEEERRYKNGSMPEVLDIIRINIIKYKQNMFQIENYLIDDNYYWEKTGEFKKSDLSQLIDTPLTLWSHHDNSYWGQNDRIPEDCLTSIKNSLYLLEMNNSKIIVKDEGASFGRSRRKVRAEFVYRDVMYRLPVTDPRIERYYFKKDDGTYTINKKHHICVSIGLPYESFCYIFIASIIK